jgi:hypothetical protein
MHWHRPRPQRGAHDSPHVLGMIRVLTGICLALVAGFSLSAHSMGSTRELADDCRSLLRATIGLGKEIRIPFTKKARAGVLGIHAGNAGPVGGQHLGAGRPRLENGWQMQPRAGAQRQPG